MGDFTKLSLGENYPYWNYVKTPAQIGMGTSRNDFTRDINGINAYVDVILYGDPVRSKNVVATTTGKPLGNQYFLDTGGQCCIDTSIGGYSQDASGTLIDPSGNIVTDSSGNPVDASGNTCVKTERYIYIDNIASGVIPFIGELGDGKVKTRGLLIGMIEDLADLSPEGLFYAFLDGGSPKCSKVTLQTTDLSNNQAYETHYVTDRDLANINPCVFSDRKNPWKSSNQNCGEGFSNINMFQEMNIRFPKDPMIQLYFILILILGVYILYRVSYRRSL